MTLCKYCEGIDPDAIQEVRRRLGHDERARVHHDLQPYHLMRLSAQNGCSGCRFFLDVLAQESIKVRDNFRILGGLGFNDADFPQRHQRIWIETPFRLAIDGIDGIPSFFGPLGFDLDICLVQGAVYPAIYADSLNPGLIPQIR